MTSSSFACLRRLSDLHHVAEANAVEAAQKWIAKLQIKNGGYPPDANPNPGTLYLSASSILAVSLYVCIALAYHYAQLEASAFRQDFNPGEFEDPTRPKLDMIHKVRYFMESFE